MAVLNVTPDSFSDGGLHAGSAEAVEAALEMAEAGADLIDVGGESTRPGAEPVSAAEEADRVLPVIEGIRRRHDVRLSVDTAKAAVARQALDAGADLVNDVTALGDPEMLPLLVQRGVPVALMHMRGDPRTMQRDTRYDDLTGEVAAFLSQTVETTVAAGLSNDKIMIDPGIGFGKSVEGNLAILRRLPALARLGKPILIGASRKSFIGATLDLPVRDRLEGSLAIAACAAMQGAHVIRAHDVTATIRTVRMIDAIRGV
jgi:dihydropteroate synthase